MALSKCGEPAGGKSIGVIMDGITRVVELMSSGYPVRNLARVPAPTDPPGMFRDMP